MAPIAFDKETILNLGQLGPASLRAPNKEGL